MKTPPGMTAIEIDTEKAGEILDGARKLTDMMMLKAEQLVAIESNKKEEDEQIKLAMAHTLLRMKMTPLVADGMMAVFSDMVGRQVAHTIETCHALLASTSDNESREKIVELSTVGTMYAAQSAMASGVALMCGVLDIYFNSEGLLSGELTEDDQEEAGGEAMVLAEQLMELNTKGSIEISQQLNDIIALGSCSDCGEHGSEFTDA